MRNAASIVAGAFLLTSQPPITPSTSALMLIRPSPSVTGSIILNTRLTAGSRQSITICRRPSRPRSQGSGSRNCTTVPTRIEPAYT